jgi:hypothetical protein
MYDAQVVETRKVTAGVDVETQRLRRVFSTACEESSRSAAILLFALAEDVMLSAFKRHLNPDVAGGWKSIAEGSGVLATASDRIALLELLFWARKSVCADVRPMKAIRNRFAHHADVDTFEDAKVRGWVSTMTAHEKPALEGLKDAERARSKPYAVRKLFLMRACTTVAILASDLCVMPIARDRKVDPAHVTATWEECPDNLKELRRVAAAVLLHFEQAGAG